MTWADQEIVGALCHGALEIDEVSLNQPGWAVLNNWVFMQPAAVRGEDNLVSGEPGVLPNRRRKTVTTHSLEMLVVGTVDTNGDPVLPEDWAFQLAVNLEWLDENVFTPPVTLRGTRTAVLRQQNGWTREGEIHLGSPVLGVSFPMAATLTIDISIPAGQLGPLTPPGS